MKFKKILFLNLINSQPQKFNYLLDYIPEEKNKLLHNISYKSGNISNNNYLFQFKTYYNDGFMQDDNIIYWSDNLCRLEDWKNYCSKKSNNITILLTPNTDNINFNTEEFNKRKLIMHIITPFISSSRPINITLLLTSLPQNIIANYFMQIWRDYKSSILNKFPETERNSYESRLQSYYDNYNLSSSSIENINNYETPQLIYHPNYITGQLATAS